MNFTFITDHEATGRGCFTSNNKITPSLPTSVVSLDSINDFGRRARTAKVEEFPSQATAAQ